MENTPKETAPLVRIGQSEYARDYPAEINELPDPNEGGSVGLLILILIYFIAGLVIGAWLW